jgi:hypothetical protein
LELFYLDSFHFLPHKRLMQMSCRCRISLMMLTFHPTKLTF